MITIKDVNRILAQHVKRGADLVYLFETINSDWLSPLWEAGIFKDPPEPVKYENLISYPNWPASQYLLRIAQSTTDTNVQSLILSIIKDIPESDNERVDATLTQVAIELPPDLAKQWAARQESRIKAEDHIGPMRAQALFDLATRLAKNGYTRIALYLLRALFTVLPDASMDDMGPLGTLPRTRTKIRSWQYGHLMEKKLPKFISHCDPLVALKILLCPLLDEAIKYEAAGSDEVEGVPIDYSHVWRPVLAKSDRPDFTPYELLTTAVISTTSSTAKAKPEFVPKLVSILEGRDPLRPIFVRIALHMLLHFPCHSQHLISERLASKKIMSDYRISDEYVDLLKKEFPNMDPSQQGQVVNNILAGPPHENDPLSEESEERKAKWQLQRLQLISDHLPDDVSDFYRHLKSRYGEPSEHPRNVGITSWVGPTSPLSAGEMAVFTPSEMIQYLIEWVITDEWDAPTPEGVSRELAKVVESQAADYAASAMDFSVLEPTYIKGFVDGLKNTFQVFQWMPVLKLCKWVVDQPREYFYETEVSSSGMDRDPDWGWTRKSIAHLLRQGLKPGPNQIPYQARDLVLSICEELMRDPEPTPEYENHYGGGRMDFMNMAINTVRGAAMHAVMAYAVWVTRHLRENTASMNGQNGLDMFPRVQKILEAHLSINQDPSLAIRAVYGAWFSDIRWVDQDWADAAVSRLFPLELDKKAYFHASWSSFVAVSRADRELFGLLEKRYLHGVELLANAPEDVMQSKYKMAEHVSDLFLMKCIDLSDHGVLHKFFCVADDHLRSYTVARIASGMSGSIAEGSSESHIGRLKSFWDQRLERINDIGSPEEFKQELSAFGNWFLSDDFEDFWVIVQLTRTLKLSKSVSPLTWGDVCEKLYRLSAAFPLQTVHCIKYLAEGQNDWFFATTGHCKDLLTSVINSGNEEAAARAKEVADYLIAKGLSDYGSVVN